MTFSNTRGQTLTGTFYPAEGDGVVVFAHGFGSERTSKGRFVRMAGALCDIGLSCLAFDFAGCGDSNDDTLTAAKQVEDLRAATAFVKSKGFQRIALYGHSLGSLICLRAYCADVITMVLSGAATGPMKYDWARYFTREQLRELAETGFLTMHPQVGPRQDVVLEAQMLKDFEQFDQEKLLRNVRCPVLIIHGDADEEERMLLKRSTSGMKYLPPESRLDVIPGAVHGFYDHLDELVERTRDWLIRYMVEQS